MKKFLIIIFILSFTLVGCSNNNMHQNDNKENTDYNAFKTANTNEINTESEFSDTEIKSALEETDLSSFSTKIYTPNDEARQNNITLTCSKLNGTIVKAR